MSRTIVEQDSKSPKPRQAAAAEFLPAADRASVEHKYSSPPIFRHHQASALCGVELPKPSATIFEISRRNRNLTYEYISDWRRGSKER